jgi:hypothetical protein
VILVTVDEPGSVDLGRRRGGSAFQQIAGFDLQYLRFRRTIRVTRCAAVAGALLGSRGPVELARIAETLSPSQIVGEAAVEISDLAYDTRAVSGARSSSACAGALRRARARDRAIDAGAAALVVEQPVASRVPQLVVGGLAAGDGCRGARVLRQPSDELEIAASPGTNGKTTTAFLLYSILEGRGPQAGAAGHDRVSDRRRVPARRSHDARGDRPPARLPRDARRGRPQRRDGGDVTRLELGRLEGSASRRSHSRT